MDSNFLVIGGFEIKWYSICLLIAVCFGVFILAREGKKHGIAVDKIIDIAFYALIFGFIGARAYFVLFNYQSFLSDPLSIFKTWEGGLAIHGGLIAGITAIYFYTKKHNISFLRILDMATIPVLLGQAIGRWGNFFNAEAHGVATTIETLQRFMIPDFVIEGMNIHGIYYHPTFYYEFLWCMLGVLVLFILKRYRYLKIGQLSSIYLIWYGIGRFFIESMRTDSLMILGFKTAQIVSVLMIALGIGYLIYSFKKGKYENLYHEQKVKA